MWRPGSEDFSAGEEIVAARRVTARPPAPRPEDAWRPLHDEASRNREATYTDPATGLAVFTEYALRQRGRCCASGCRHCPYPRSESSPERACIPGPLWLTGLRAPAEAVDILFWSGGKDSFLSYRALQREGARPVVLLTTFDAGTCTIAHQELPLESVVRQAEHLGIPLLGVPLHPAAPYEARVEEALARVPSAARLVFGDLHLEHIREWRTSALGVVAARCGASLHFPLWGVSYETLLEDLEASGIVCEICAVTEAANGAVRPGERFDRRLMRRLPESVDRFGERGEFHTLAKVWAAGRAATLARPCQTTYPS